MPSPARRGPIVCLIVARSRNNVIGRAGGLPWRLRDDLKHFRQTTMGAPVVMGRRTWEGLPVRPLPGRDCIIVTRDWKYPAEGARVYSAPNTALAAARAIGARQGCAEVFVIGGAQLYETVMPLADKIYLTEVDAEIEGDAFLRGFNEAEWTETARLSHPADLDNEHAFVIRTLLRKD